jgi:hypothetical protein
LGAQGSGDRRILGTPKRSILLFQLSALTGPSSVVHRDLIIGRSPWLDPWLKRAHGGRVIPACAVKRVAGLSKESRRNTRLDSMPATATRSGRRALLRGFVTPPWTIERLLERHETWPSTPTTPQTGPSPGTAAAGRCVHLSDRSHLFRPARQGTAVNSLRMCEPQQTPSVRRFGERGQGNVVLPKPFLGVERTGQIGHRMGQSGRRRTKRVLVEARSGRERWHRGTT